MNRISRKDFVRIASMAAISVPVLGLSNCAPGKKEESNTQTDAGLFSTHPGLQLYTVRDAFAKDPSGTFKRLASIGFKEIELHDPSALVHTKEIRDLGMNVISTHFLPGYVTGLWNDAGKYGIPVPKDNLEQIAESCAKNDVHYMGISILWPEQRPDLDGYKRFADLANKAGEKAKAAGVQLYYHNHSFEFEPTQGTTPYEEMLKIFEPELVKLELDVFWTTVSGNDAATWIEKLKGRVKMLHLKDLKAETPKDYTTFQVDHGAFQAMGDGVVDFRKVLAAAKAADVPYGFVEQDHSAIDPFESITRSIQYLKSLGL